MKKKMINDSELSMSLLSGSCLNGYMFLQLPQLTIKNMDHLVCK